MRRDDVDVATSLDDDEDHDDEEVETRASGVVRDVVALSALARRAASRADRLVIPPEGLSSEAKRTRVGKDETQRDQRTCCAFERCAGYENSRHITRFVSPAERNLNRERRKHPLRPLLVRVMPAPASGPQRAPCPAS